MYIDKNKLDRVKNDSRKLLQRHENQTPTEILLDFKGQLDKTIKMFTKEQISESGGLPFMLAETFYLWWLTLLRDFPSFVFQNPKKIYLENFSFEIKLYCLESLKEEDVTELLTKAWVIAEVSTNSVLKEYT